MENKSIYERCRYRAYVIVGHDPKNGKVAGYFSMGLQTANEKYVEYFVPEFSYGKPYFNKKGNPKGKNQITWNDLTYLRKWISEHWPDFDWKVYRANSKYCPITVDIKNLINYNGKQKSYAVPFKVKENWNWNEKI